MAARARIGFFAALLVACGGARVNAAMDEAPPVVAAAPVDAASTEPASAREACYGVETARSVRSFDGGTDAQAAFARARSYYERHQWAEAAALFEDVASTDVAAAELCLEAVNVLSRERPACRDAIAELAPRFAARWCGDAGARPAPPDGAVCMCGDPLCDDGADGALPCAPRSDSEELCDVLQRIEADLQRDGG